MDISESNNNYNELMSWFKITHFELYEKYGSNIEYKEGKFYVNGKNDLNEIEWQLEMLVNILSHFPHKPSLS